MKNKCILIVTSRFYPEISDSLESESINLIKERGYSYKVIDVPGAFEVPAAISCASENSKYIGYVALGCVIRGETSHYDYVCQESARALMELSLQGLSIGYGILTCENKEQALIRASSDGLNKGKAATLACLRMINIKKEVLE
jgi:6,7-dimethyl-8-ribityllumazine synthase